MPPRRAEYPAEPEPRNVRGRLQQVAWNMLHNLNMRSKVVQTARLVPETIERALLCNPDDNDAELRVKQLLQLISEARTRPADIDFIAFSTNSNETRRLENILITYIQRELGFNVLDESVRGIAPDGTVYFRLRMTLA